MASRSRRFSAKGLHSFSDRPPAFCKARRKISWAALENSLSAKTATGHKRRSWRARPYARLTADSRQARADLRPPTRKFPKCRSFLSLVNWCGSSAAYMKTPKPKQWAQQEVRRLITLARRGVGASKIAGELGRHAGSVRRMARTLGLLLKK